MPRTTRRPTSLVRQQPRWMGLGTIKAPAFAQKQHQFFNAHVTDDDALLDGHIQALQVHPDISLHAVEGCDLRTLTSTVPAQQGLHIVIVLEGCIDVAFGTLPLQLQPAGAPDTTVSACGALIHTCQPEAFVRNWRMGKFERKLSVCVHPRLLQSLAATASYEHLQAIRQQHLYMQHWQPSSRAVALAEQLIHWSCTDQPSLLLQSRALEFVHEAVQQAGHETALVKHPSQHLREHLRMAKLKALLDSQSDANTPIATLANEIGMSVSALQRHFRHTYGTSVDDYRRSQCLERARALLEQTGSSVLEVAHVCGYTSAANFSTAFKRHFGIAPKLVRSKL
jgi:AraC-like DNA-binding protein